MEEPQELKSRTAALNVPPEEFRRLGYQLVDRIADFLTSLPGRPITSGETRQALQVALGGDSVPAQGAEPGRLLEEATTLLFDHSLFNGHPRFWGYITASPAPIGALGELLAAVVNPNVGAGTLSPIATELEAQTVRWIAELIGYPSDCGGLLTSGGNMGNFIGFLAARKARLPWDVRASGMLGDPGRRPRIYASNETHTWIQKSADLAGFGTDAIRWVPTDAHLRMDTTALRTLLREDQQRGDAPFLLVGTAGSVSTGAIDPLPELATLCREYGLWFHVDGAYGGLAAMLPTASSDLKGLSLADSVAVDPHKWLYAPLEAGCALVRNRQILHDTFHYHPTYYQFDAGEEVLNYLEYGPQNSRGFRALKVWLALRQIGRNGYERLISEDIRLSEEMFRRIAAHPELEARAQVLSITTFRYIPTGLHPGSVRVEAYLNHLNTELVTRLQQGGEVFVSNAVVQGTYLLRACIVNFRTSSTDVAALPAIVARVGREVDAELRPSELQKQEGHDVHL
jgi:glutamate/tyrosine decarboxylase-like PLP-dependent enzyme